MRSPTSDFDEPMDGHAQGRYEFSQFCEHDSSANGKRRRGKKILTNGSVPGKGILMKRGSFKIDGKKSLGRSSFPCLIIISTGQSSPRDSIFEWILSGRRSAATVVVSVALSFILGVAHRLYADEQRQTILWFSHAYLEFFRTPCWCRFFFWYSVPTRSCHVVNDW